jgi:hypothetical protein
MRGRAALVAVLLTATLAVGPLDTGAEHDLAVGSPGEDVGAATGDGDGVAELAAGAPGENVDRAVDAGGVELFADAGSRLLHQGMLGSVAESGDGFGSALATG